MWRTLAAAPASERLAAWVEIETQVESQGYVDEHAGELSQMLVETMHVHLPRQCQKIRHSIIEHSIRESKEFAQRFAVEMVQGSKSCACVGKCKLLLWWSACVLRVWGADGEMGKAVQGLIGMQEAVLQHLVKVNRVPMKRSHNSVRLVLMGQPCLLDAYLVRCESSVSGSAGLVCMLWSAAVAVSRTLDVDGARKRLLSVFVDKILSSRKSVPDGHELACFRGVLSAATLEEFETLVLPVAVKMAKRSPEASMGITNYVIHAVRIDLSGCSGEFGPLIIQQAKHGKESVRQLAHEMMDAVVRKTADAAVIQSYAKDVSDALVGANGAKLKSPQERASMGRVLGSICVAGSMVVLPEEFSSSICETLCDAIKGEAIADAKIVLIETLGKWIEVCGNSPPGFCHVAQTAIKGPEAVRRAFLGMATSVCCSNDAKVAGSCLAFLDDLIQLIVDGVQKAAGRWDAMLSLSQVLQCAQVVSDVEHALENKGIYDILNREECPFLSVEDLKSLSKDDMHHAVDFAQRLLTVSKRISKAYVDRACTCLIFSSIHYDIEVRRKAQSAIKAIVKSDDTWEISWGLLDSLCASLDDPRVGDFLSPKPLEILKSNIAVHERFLGSLISIVPVQNVTNVQAGIAVAACVLAHHHMVSGARGYDSAWRTVRSSSPNLRKSIEENVDDALDTILGTRWGVCSVSCDLQTAAFHALKSLGAMSGKVLFDQFLDRMNVNLDPTKHDTLSAKEIRIYATPFGRLSNESEDGGLIPAELMEDMLADKSSLEAPTFEPSLEYSISFRDESLVEDLSTKGRKEDPAAAARRKQIAQEAEIRLEVVQLRETLSTYLLALGNFASGAKSEVQSRLIGVAEPCLRFLASPLLGASSALQCLNLIISCLPGLIGRHHSVLSTSIYLIAREESRPVPNYDYLATNSFVSKAARILISATGGSPPFDDKPAVKGTMSLSPQTYSFFFPIPKAILRSNRPTELHQSLLEYVELHANVQNQTISILEESRLIFHVLEVVPAFRVLAQELLTKFCVEGDDPSTIFEAVIQGVLLSQSSSRLAALTSIEKALDRLSSAKIAEPSLALTWIAANDVASEPCDVGKIVWEAVNKEPSLDLVKEILKHCSNEFHDVRKSACKALGNLVCILKSTHPGIENTTLLSVTSDLYSRNTLISKRIGAAEALSALGPALGKSETFASLEFLLSSGFLDPDAGVRDLMMAAGVSIIDAAGESSAEAILPVFEKYLDKPTDDSLSESEYDNVRLGSVVCIAAAAQHLDPENPKVVSIVEILLDVLRTPSESVQKSVSDRLPPLIKSLGKTNKSYVEDTVSKLLHNCLEGETYGDRRGGAYGLSGCVKGLGLSSLRAYGIMEALKTGVENKKDQKSREGALIAFECLSSKLGRLFEPYVIQILPMLLSSLGDGKVEVREAADAASRVIMSQLTAQGVKLVLPSLLGGAEEKQWRAKQGSIQLLGSMAYCAPKQLSSCLPQIVPVLGEALADPHPKVSSAAKDAMDEVGSVIKNPEIAKLVPVLMSALADPNKYNKKALDTLLSTIFVNTVDSASLALIIPVVHRGLKDRSGDIKKRAARIVGNLCTLMNDPKDMSPYLPSLMPELKDALIDPLPEVRGAAAKALGSLTKGMAGLEATTAVDITPWLLETMRSENSSVERSGAAQGLAEVLAVKGPTLLDEILPRIFEDSSSRSAATREGSITLFKYLPHCMPDEFQKYLPDMLPCVLGGLADESEGVREASFAAGSVAVDLYAKSSLPLVLPAVELGAADANWRIRQSSVELLGDLLFKVAGTSGRIQQDLHDEEGEGISVEAHGQAIIEVLGLERRNDVLARLYLARTDVAYTVRSAALHVWKTIVTNTPKTLVEILPILMTRVISGLSGDGEEQRISAGQCLGELVKKLGERVLPQIVPILIDGAHAEDPLTRVGVCNGIREVASNASKTQLAEHMADLLTEIQRLLCDEDDRVRQAAGGALEIMFKTGGGSAAESVIPSLLSGLHGSEEKANKSLEGLRVVLGVRPQLLSAMVPKLVEPPMSQTDVVALGALSEVAGGSIHTFLSKILPPLFRLMEEHDEMVEATTKTLLSVSTSVEEAGLHLFISQINRGFDTPDAVYGSCVAVRLFCRNTSLDFQEHIGSLLSTLVPLLADDSSEKNLVAAWEALSAVTGSIPKEMAPSFVRALKDAVAAAKDRAIRLRAKADSAGDVTLPGLVLPKALSPFIPIYLQGVLQGSSAELRELAAEGIGELVELTDTATLKPFVIQITGPLIRIVGDRFPPQTKTAILRTMGIMMEKGGVALRPFIPQLQTTFVKCLPDASRDVRLQGAANLGTLSRMAPRLDQLVSDISSNCISAEITQKEAYLCALAAILEESGDKLKDETQDKVSEAIVEGATTAIDMEQENTIKAAAKALGKYSLHCSDSEFDRIMHYDGFGPFHLPGTSLGSRLCTALLASDVARIASSRLQKDTTLPEFLKTITALSKDVSVDVRMTAAISAGRVVISEIRASSQDTSESLSQIINIIVAHLGPDQHVEVQKQALSVLRGIASESPTVLEPYFVSLIPTVISTTKESTGATKLAAERTLAKVLQLQSGDTLATAYLATPNIGPVAKQTLNESYLRRLVRISDTDVDDLIDYTIM